MGRVHFESVGDLSPDDDRSDVARRRAVPLVPVTIVGVIAAAAAGAGAWLQRSNETVLNAVEFEETVDRATRSHRRIALYFHRSGCVPCIRARNEVLESEAVLAALGDRWIVLDVDLDAPGAAAIADRYRVTSPPTLVLADPGGNVISNADTGELRREGSLETSDVVAMLTRPITTAKARRRPDGGGHRLTSAPPLERPVDPVALEMAANAEATDDLPVLASDPD